MKKAFLLLGIFAILLVSCQNETESEFTNPEIRGTDLRLQLINSGKPEAENRTDFMSFNSVDQKSIWISKLNQVNNQNISPEINKEIDLIIEILKTNVEFSELPQNDQFQKSASRLVRLIPQGDFQVMFGSMYDYKYPGSFIDHSFSDQMIESIDRMGFVNKEVTPSSSKLDDCNCRWTCGENGGAYVTDNCEETTIGCGFLWLQSCKKREALF